MDERLLIAALKRAGKRQGWYGESQKMVAAVSGGSDSVCMLWLLMKVMPAENLLVAHVNHGIRAEAAKRDEEFVGNLAREWKLAFTSVTFDVPRGKNKGESIEEAGRRLRYGFLEECAERFGADWIAVGHTADDQVETILHNIFRGCGIRGLAGIPEKRGKIVRPVIEMRRLDLMEFLKARKIPWMTDDTNKDTSYLRNRIRHELIPYLEDSYNKKIGEHLLGLAEDARKISERRSSVISCILPRVRTEVPCAIRSWDRKRLSGIDAEMAVEILVEDCKKLGLKSLERGRLKSLARLLGKNDPWRLQWQDRIEMCGSSEYLMLVEREWLTSKKPAAVKLSFDEPEGAFSWGLWKFSWRHVSCSRSLSTGPWRMFIPKEEVRNCLLTDAATFQKQHSAKMPVPWCFRRQWPVIVAPSGNWWTLVHRSKVGWKEDLHSVAIQAELALKGDYKA